MSAESRALSLQVSPKIRSRQSRTRRRIVVESARLFVEKGFEHVSVEEIIAAAEIARSSFYRFFANREDVLASIIRPVFEHGTEELEALATTDPAQIMRGIFDTYLTLWRTGPDALRVSTRIGGKYFPLFEDVHSVFRRRIEALVGEAEKAGILLNGSAEYTVRLIARSAVPVMEVYSKDPDFEELFHKTMTGFLLEAGKSR
jgi:AcrR family transcriptional regulator